MKQLEYDGDSLSSKGISVTSLLKRMEAGSEIVFSGKKKGKWVNPTIEGVPCWDAILRARQSRLIRFHYNGKWRQPTIVLGEMVRTYGITAREED